jgi:hypothetical protein
LEILTNVSEEPTPTDTVKMEAVSSSEALVKISNITQHINPEDHCLNNYFSLLQPVLFRFES